jgi:hypothetical protein
MTSPTIDPQTMKRLAFIRLLYQQGVDQTRLPEPLTFTSALSFHDAVEHFLILAGEHLGANLPDHIQFMKYWTELNPKKLNGGVDLSGKVGMDRLNRLRNGFKHAGALPSLAAIEQARTDVSSFFEDNLPRVFGVPFAGIDMTDLIAQPEARAKVKAATAANVAGDRIEAMALLVEAFERLFETHTRPESFGGSPFSFGPRLSFPLSKWDMQGILHQPNGGSSWSPTRGSERLAEQLDWMMKVAGEAQNGLRLIALGIDFRQYYRFRQLTPAVHYTGYSIRHVQHVPYYAPSTDEFDYCHQFLITVALRIAELESHLIPPSWK